VCEKKRETCGGREGAGVVEGWKERELRGGDCGGEERGFGRE